MKTLEQISEELNKASETLNSKYTLFEEKLKRANLGVKAVVIVDPKLKLSYECGMEGWGVYIQSSSDDIVKSWRANSSPRSFRYICCAYLPNLEEALILVAENLIVQLKEIGE